MHSIYYTGFLQLVNPSFKQIYICLNDTMVYNKHMKTSRQQILDLIRTHQLLTVTDISNVLRMTKANVRHHLSILEERGEIEAIGVRHPSGKGRPAIIFSLSQKAKGDNYDQLCHTLLDFLFSPGEWENDIILEQVVNLMIKKVLEEINKSMPLTQRLFEIITYLNSNHYMARWEAHHEAPIIIFENCPYRTILDAHPELCKIDQLILKKLTKSQIHQISKLSKDKRGILQCRFVLNL